MPRRDRSRTFAELGLRPRVSLLGHEAKLADTELGNITLSDLKRLYRAAGAPTRCRGRAPTAKERATSQAPCS